MLTFRIFAILHPTCSEIRKPPKHNHLLLQSISDIPLYARSSMKYFHFQWNATSTSITERSQVSLHYWVTECHCNGGRLKHRHLCYVKNMCWGEYSRLTDMWQWNQEFTWGTVNKLNVYAMYRRGEILFMSRSSNLWHCIIVLRHVLHHP